MKYHTLKQAQPQKRKSKHLEFVFLRPKGSRRLSKKALYLSHAKRRRPYDTIVEENENEKKQVTKGEKHKRLYKIENIAKILSERLNNVNSGNSFLKSTQFQNGLQAYISPRKRILKELEKVSLEDIATLSKRSRAKKPVPLAIPSNKIDLSSTSSSTPSISFHNNLTKSSSSFPNDSFKSTSSSRISSYSINSLLNHDSRSIREPSSTSQNNLTKHNSFSGNNSEKIASNVNVKASEMHTAQRDTYSHMQASSSFVTADTTDKPQRLIVTNSGAKPLHTFQTSRLTSNNEPILNEFSYKYHSDNVLSDFKPHHHQTLTHMFSLSPSRENTMFPYSTVEEEKNSLAIRNECRRMSQVEDYSVSKNTFQANATETPGKLTMSMQRGLLPEQLHYTKYEKGFECQGQDKINFLNKSHQFTQLGIQERSNFLDKISASKVQPATFFSSSDYSNQNIATYYQQIYAAAAARYHHSVWFQYPVFDPVLDTMEMPTREEQTTTNKRFKNSLSKEDNPADGELP